MATRQADVGKLVARIRKAGWPVRSTGAGQYRVSMPGGESTLVHTTYSDVNALKAVMRILNDHGFEAAEAKAQKAEDRKRNAALVADRVENERALKVAAQRSRIVAKAAGPYAFDDVDDSWFLQAHPAPTVRKVMCTPGLAQKLSDLNSGNRPKKPRQLARLTKRLEAGIHEQGDPPDDKWILMHQGVAIDSNGVLQDGQNRLDAIIATGVTAPLFIFVGMDPAAFPHIDTVVPRSAADMVARVRETDANSAAAIARLVYLHQRVHYGVEKMSRRAKEAHRVLYKSTWRSEVVENSDVVSMFESDAEGFAEAAAYARLLTSKKSLELQRAAIGAAAYLIHKANPRDPKVTEFFEGIRTGEDLSKGDPRLALVRLARNMVDKKMRRDSTEGLALVLKTWNAWITGQRMDTIRWAVTEPMPRPVIRRTGKEAPQ